MVSKLIILTVLIVAVGVGVHSLPPILTIGYQGATRTPITIIKFGIRAGSALSPCDPKNAPRTKSYNNWDECANNCPNHCAAIRNCNATCVMEGRCVCATNQYCLYDRSRPEGNTYHLDCFHW